MFYLHGDRSPANSLKSPGTIYQSSMMTDIISVCVCVCVCVRVRVCKKKKKILKSHLSSLEQYIKRRKGIMHFVLQFTHYWEDEVKLPLMNIRLFSIC